MATHVPMNQSEENKKYLKQPKVMKLMEDIVSHIIHEKPEDPEKCILAFLSARHPSASGAPSATAGDAPALLEWLVNAVNATSASIANGTIAAHAVEPVAPPGAPAEPQKAAAVVATVDQLHKAIRLGQRRHSDLQRGQLEAHVAKALLQAATVVSNGSLEEEQVLQQVVEGVKNLLQADRCSVFVADEDKRELHTIIEGKPFFLKYGQGIAGTVAKTNCSLLITDAYEDPRFDSKVDIELGYVTRNILCMPVILDDRLVAVVQLVNKIGGVFTRDDESLFASFAQFAGMRIRNAALYKEQQRLALRNTKMAEVAETLANTELDESILIPVIIRTAKSIVGADRCAFFVADEERGTLTSHLEGVDEQIIIPISTGIAGWVAQNQRFLNVPDAYADGRFNKEVDVLSGYRTHNILCFPIFLEKRLVAVAQLVNKTNPSSKQIVSFTAEDESVLQSFASICGVCIRNCRLVKAVTQRRAVTESLLEVIRTMLQSDISDSDAVMQNIAASACRVSRATRCLVFMLDDSAKQLHAPNPDDPGRSIRVRVGDGLVGQAFRSGTTCHVEGGVPDDEHARFGTGIAVTNVVVIPIALSGVFTAAVAFVNKEDGEKFTDEDIESMELLASFAGVVIRDARLLVVSRREYDDWQTLMSLGRAASEADYSPSPQPPPSSSASNPILPAAAPDPGAITFEELDAVRSLVVAPEVAAELPLRTFNVHQFRDGDYDPRLLVGLVVRMFQAPGLDLLNRFQIDEDKFWRFTLRVRAKYRDVPYHNFFHAFDVTQTLFSFVHYAKLTEVFPPHELLALLVAGMVHDMDHMGLNNAFHMKAETPMGLLTSLTGNKSVLEVHHATLAIEILTSLNLFGNVEHTVRTQIFKMLIDAVLATDMAVHKDLCDQFQKELSGGVKKDSPESRRLAIIMLLKMADISNITKPFDVSRKWGIRVMEEFYRQGDAERQQGLDVTPMFDREKKVELAKGQLGFIKFMGKPFFQIGVQCFPELRHLTETIDDNIGRWEKVLEQSAPAAPPA